MSNVVNFKRKEENMDDEVLAFIKNKKHVIITFDEESNGIEILSNLLPGIQEATMLHIAYLDAVDLARGLMHDDEE
ncbi:hypothetical protein [Cecembia sp.]|uniref:hypothetical protein n=1 Tax=Cecembia sp. TaxID=1898110 RepID=UPI0025BB58E5|nr:hypothetical protein [Cecembia sp.]